MERRVFKKPHSKQFRKLRRQLSNASNEEEVRLAWVRSLEATLGITFDAERGKRDLSYNNAVIEFKGPGKFNGKTTSSAFQEAVHERLLPYIRRTAEEEHINESDYIGIAIDDSHLAFAQVVDGETTGPPDPVLSAGEVALLASAGGLGKSYLALALAVAASEAAQGAHENGAVCGLRVKAGPGGAGELRRFAGADMGPPGKADRQAHRGGEPLAGPGPVVAGRPGEQGGIRALWPLGAAVG